MECKSSDKKECFHEEMNEIRDENYDNEKEDVTFNNENEDLDFN